MAHSITMQHPSSLLGATSSNTENRNEKLLGLPRCSGLVCGSSIPTLPLPYHHGKSTCTVKISDTVEFHHHHLTNLEVTPMDRIVHGVNKLTCALKDAPQIACDNQIFTINALQQAVQRWMTSNTSPHAQPLRTTTLHHHTLPRSILQPMLHPR